MKIKKTMLRVHLSIFPCHHRFANSQYGKISRQTLKNKICLVGRDSGLRRPF